MPKNLEKPFSEEEIFKALLEFRRDKALGMDGFHMAFWHFFWDLVKEDILTFLGSSMSMRDLSKS